MKAGAAPGQQNRIICVASLAHPDRALGRSDSAGSAADNNDIAYRAVDNGSTESRFSASLSLGRAPRTRLNDPCHGLVQGKGPQTRAAAVISAPPPLVSQDIALATHKRQPGQAVRAAPEPGLAFQR
jgi:hypothetical protein